MKTKIVPENRLKCIEIALLIGLAVFSGEEAAYGSGCALRAEYQYFEGGSDKVEFYPIEGQNRYAAMLNGQYTGQIRGSELEALLPLIP